MRARLSIDYIWNNIYSGDYQSMVDDYSNPCNECDSGHSLRPPIEQWGSKAFQTMKMHDPAYKAWISKSSYNFDEFINYTKEHGQIGDITIFNRGPHLTLDNGHHRLYIAWLLKETYVRVIIVGNRNVIPENAFEPNSINSDYLYV